MPAKACRAGPFSSTFLAASRISRRPFMNPATPTSSVDNDRNYNAAITALNTLQSNFSILDAIRKSGKARNQDAIPEMKEWCRRIGYEPAEFNTLNAIHIAGTKGKGSTSAFISSILCQYLPRASTVPNGHPPEDQHPHQLHKVGLYTSPHLRSVRERIQINNQPLSESKFAQYFFEVWDRLEAAATKMGLPSSTPSSANTILAPAPNAQAPTKPVYFRYLTLMALHTYLREGVDTAVIECGIGGEYDSTNILVEPSVAAVTSLGIDHTFVLGDTVEEIAWHKGGIFKPRSKTGQVFTVDSQAPSALQVLQRRADDVNVKLSVVPRHPDIAADRVKLGLAADFQKTNASLAVAVAAAHLRALGVPDIPLSLSDAPLPAKFRRGLEVVQWGGRCEVRREGSIVWHLDGGHTIESIRLAAQWFASCISTGQRDERKTQKRVLLFNQQTRDAPALARALHAALTEALRPANAESMSTEYNKKLPASENRSSRSPLFTHALFSTNITFASALDAPSSSTTTLTRAGGRYKPDLISMNTSTADVSKLTVQRELAEVWAMLDPETGVQVLATVEEAVAAVRAIGNGRSGIGEDGERVEVSARDETMVLVTGSLHLVGGVLEVLETTKPVEQSAPE